MKLFTFTAATKNTQNPVGLKSALVWWFFSRARLSERSTFVQGIVSPPSAAGRPRAWLWQLHSCSVCVAFTATGQEATFVCGVCADSRGSRQISSLIGHGRKAAGPRCLWSRPTPYRHFNPLYVRFGLPPLLRSQLLSLPRYEWTLICILSVHVPCKKP